jgi:hypothetical protein
VALLHSALAWGWGLVALFVVAYFVPSVIAFMRGHHNRAAILALNILLAWSVFGWIISFVWALTYVDEYRS